MFPPVTSTRSELLLWARTLGSSQRIEAGLPRALSTTHACYQYPKALNQTHAGKDHPDVPLAEILAGDLGKAADS